VLFRRDDGTNYVWHIDGSVISGGLLTISSQGLLPAVDTSWAIVGEGDYNGDGKSDVLWRKNDGTNYVWHVDGATISGGVLSISSQGLLPRVDKSRTVQNPKQAPVRQPEDRAFRASSSTPRAQAERERLSTLLEEASTRRPSG
jgi:hypothetical protein